jgi:Phage integrase family
MPSNVSSANQEPRIRLQDLRHTHATLLLKAEAPITVVNEQLGHSTPGFTVATFVARTDKPGVQTTSTQQIARLMAAIHGCALFELTLGGG